MNWPALAFKAADVSIPSLGSCGALIDIPPGSLVVPKACVAINRNWDYDFINGDTTQQPYFITKQVCTEPILIHSLRLTSLAKVEADQEIYEEVMIHLSRVIFRF